MSLNVRSIRLAAAALLFLLPLLIPALLTAQIPRTISYQGVMTEQNGSPVADGSHLVTFTIYGQQTGGTALYTETQSVNFSNGLFTALIGSTVAIPNGLKFDRPYWLGIAIDGGVQAGPRIPFTSSPYALNAHTADSARSLSESATVVRSINGGSGDLTFMGAGNTTVERVGSTITIATFDGGGAGSIELVRNTDGALNILNGAGPTATINVRDSGIKGRMLADRTITPSKLDTTGATAGQVLLFDGGTVRFGNAGTAGFALPFSTTAGTSNTLLSITDTGLGSVARFRVQNSGNGSHALIGETDAVSSWNGPAGVHGLNTGPSGVGVLGTANGSQLNGVPPRGVYGVSDSGVGVYGFSQTAVALYGQANGGSTAVGGSNVGTGTAADFQVNNAASAADAMIVQTNGDGNGIVARRTKTSGTNAAVLGEVASTSNGSGLTAGATGLLGRITPTGAGGWSAGVRGINNSTTGNGIGVVGYQAGSGWGVAGQTESGIGVRAVTSDGGNSFVAIYNGSTTSSTTANNIAIFQAPSPNGGSAINQARIDNTGKGYFNGGTVNSGADVAELFEVEESHELYQPGDVMAISTDTDRTLTLVSEPYSQLVVGVYATRPGVLLTEEHIDSDFGEMVPLGVIGVLPTKVCDENGPIRRGDILVSSSRPGYAMKADPELLKDHPGAMLGKALENFEGEQTGVIRVLVNVR